jgi:hypothetical protein
VMPRPPSPTTPRPEYPAAVALSMLLMPFAAYETECLRIRLSTAKFG